MARISGINGKVSQWQTERLRPTYISNAGTKMVSNPRVDNLERQREPTAPVEDFNIGTGLKEPRRNNADGNNGRR